MMPRKGNPAAGPIAALAFISLVWGYNWVVMKESLRYAGPFDFNALRMALGSVFLFAFMAWKREPLRGGPIPVWDGPHRAHPDLPLERA